MTSKTQRPKSNSVVSIIYHRILKTQLQVNHVDIIHILLEIEHHVELKQLIPLSNSAFLIHSPWDNSL